MWLSVREYRDLHGLHHGMNRRAVPITLPSRFDAPTPYLAPALRAQARSPRWAALQSAAAPELDGSGVLLVFGHILFFSTYRTPLTLPISLGSGTLPYGYWHAGVKPARSLMSHATRPTTSRIGII